MLQKELSQKIESYFDSLEDDRMPNKFKQFCTVVLSGSAGWGIKEGEDNKADWDLHVIMKDSDYEDFMQIKSDDYIIDDQHHTPLVFIQFHNLTWLLERLNGIQPNSWPLYLWIYTNCLIVNDPICVSDIISEYKNKFAAELPELIKRYHITFSTRRLDTCSSALRGLKMAAGINRAEMVKAALQTLCLLKREPFAYNKWLLKEIELLYKDDIDIAQIIDTCNKCLYENDLNNLVKYAKLLRDQIETELTRKLGEQRWIHFWWEFNKN